MHILGAIAEFERARIAERVKAGLARARANGTRLGRPKAVVPAARLATVAHLPAKQAAAQLRVSLSTLKRYDSTRLRRPNPCHASGPTHEPSAVR